MLGQARVGSIPTGIGVSHKDPLRYTGMVYLSVLVRSKLFARMDLMRSQH